MNGRRKIKAITFSGLTIALIVVLLFLSSIIEVLDYTACAICGIAVTFILVEFGTGYAVSVYFGASILGLVMIPSKVSAVLFVAFCGWYPFIKRYLERIKPPFDIIAKLCTFNLSLSVLIAVARFVLLAEGLAGLTLIFLYVAGNVTFLLYDVLITKLIWLYVHKYRKLMKFL